MDHQDTESDKAKRIAKTSFANLPDEAKKRISIRITQKHKVLIKMDIDQIDDACQKQDLDDWNPDTGIGQRNFLAQEAGSNIGDDQIVIEKLMDRIEI